MIAFYYGLTGFACVWYYRKSLTRKPRNFWLRGMFPLARWSHPLGRMVWAFWYNWNPSQQLHDVDPAGHEPHWTSAGC